MKRQIFSLFLLLLTLVACGDKPLDPNKPVYVRIKTTMGDVTVLLYDDTPLHRDNFIKLCQSNEYEGMLFHRVIKEFVVQGGDPEARAWAAGRLLQFQLAAQRALAAQGIRAPVRVYLVNMYFPARRYPTGQLPAGRYDAVRIDIGSGGGRNWWCVLYPGLCSFAQGGYALPAENDLVCGQYILRFRLVDWAHRLTAQRQTVLLAG